MTKTLKGIAASDGIAVAPAYRLVEPDLSFTKASVDDVEQEVARFEKAVETSILMLKVFVILLKKTWVKKKLKFSKRIY